MQRSLLLGLGVGVLGVALLGIAPSTYLVGQEAKEDAISKQVGQLESELGKYRDTTPEAAAAMLKLMDLYHQDARVFGLVRIGRKFVTAHPTHPKHKQVMLQLIDGLESTARYTDLVAACRQFLGQYGDSPEAGDIDLRLTTALDQMGKAAEAAEAYRAAWNRQPNEKGRRFGSAGVQRFSYLNTPEGRTNAAKLAEDMLDKTGTGPFAEFAGWQAFAYYRAVNDWAKSNTVGAKLIKAGLPADKESQRTLHTMMSENYHSLGQFSNALASIQAARALGDDQYLHGIAISRMFNFQETKPADMAALVNDYATKYKDAPERHIYRGYLAQVYLRTGDKANALQTIASLLPVDAASNNQAAVYVQQQPNAEPATLAAVEKVLVDAIAKNEPQAAYLRFVLATDLYRDRMKDVAKMRQTYKDLVTKSPEDSHYSQTAVLGLLSSASSDAEFNADVELLAKARDDNWFRGGFISRMGEWATANDATAKANKDAALAARVAKVRAALGKVDNDPVVQGYYKTNYATVNDGNGAKYRSDLISSKRIDNLNDTVAWNVLYYEAYYNRQAGQGKRAIEVFDLLRKRFPKNVQAAYGYMEACYHYATPLESHESADHYMQVADVVTDPQAWYYLVLNCIKTLDKQGDTDEMKVANKAKNTALMKRALALINNSQEKMPTKRTEYGSMIGDNAVTFGLPAEGMAYWKMIAGLNMPSNSEVIACNLKIAGTLEGPAKVAYIQGLLDKTKDYPGQYVQFLAGAHLATPDLKAFEALLTKYDAYHAERATFGSGFEEGTLTNWINTFGVPAVVAPAKPREVSDADKMRIYAAISDLRFRQSSAMAELSLLALTPADALPPIQRVLRYSRATQMAGNAPHYWDQLMGLAQAAIGRKEFLETATLVTGMLANVPNIDEPRRKAGRDMVAASYSRIGAVGVAIDEKSPIAPLLQAAMMLRLGDDRLAFDAYTSNMKLFDEHRSEIPVDFILFVCEKHAAAGGEENFERVEDILRGWLVQFGENPQYDNQTKAQVQLLLARNFLLARRFDVARGEYTTLKNRYPETKEALEAEFGIGETFMAQKVYDQAEAVFDKLATSRDKDVVTRAEFLRGVLAYRRGDRDEARDIFRAVLERVPNIDLANRSLFNLAEVYGDEERYADQLSLLRNVGRLGSASKRQHKPGMDLSIVVQDSDLGISRGHNKIPVVVTTVPGGDSEIAYLTSGGAGKGLFSLDLRTELGRATKNDRVLQLTGNDVIKCDYPEDFKAGFKQVPLSDVEIQVSADADFEVASSEIVDKTRESFSDILKRENEEEDDDKRVSQERPANQIKPGNPIYMRVRDADRDLSDDADKVIVKLSAQSGDEVQVALMETGPHTGIFTGTATSGELPAGALASDSAINHSPLMAIDRDGKSFWLSEPNGSVPKDLAIDMKDLKTVSKVRISTPDANNQCPVRGDLFGSNDGHFWFKIASQPPAAPQPQIVGKFGHMTRRVYPVNATGYTTWQQVVDLTKNGKPSAEGEVEEILYSVPAEEDASKAPCAAVWHGKLVQPRDGAARIAVVGNVTGLSLDGRVELPVGPGTRSVDVWLKAGNHDLVIFSAVPTGAQPMGSTWARATLSSAPTQLASFRPSDFDLDQPELNVKDREAAMAAPVVKTADGDWEFTFEPLDLRHVKFVVHEYRGEAVAINNVEIRGEEDDQLYIPTEADVLTLANNDTLEIAGGDIITATYSDEKTQSEAGRSRLLTSTLTATFFNGDITPISYDFVKLPNGTTQTVAKDLIRVDPGERFIVEIIDFDRDETNKPDTVKFSVMVNDGEPIEMTATETEPFTGKFTKEVDTSATAESGKLQVKKGDKIYCRYIDSQNTFPGHSVPRETVVYVREPSEARVRVIETRATPAKPELKIPAQVSYLTGVKGQDVASVAFEAPFTVEVIDRDAAKDSKSEVQVALATTSGVKIVVNCAVSAGLSDGRYGNILSDRRLALEEGRFIGQVIMQLGGKESPEIVPLSVDMPRNLIGGSKIEDEGDSTAVDKTVVTRVLNVTGQDDVSVTYVDQERPGGSPQELGAKARLITNGQLLVTDRDYEKEVTQLHVGEKLFLQINDADHDQSDERDMVKVQIKSQNGEEETVSLEETAAHSGIFNGSLTLKANEKPTAGNLNQDDPIVETYFGDELEVKYVDKSASSESGVLELVKTIPVVIGTDGLVAAFSKAFNDEKLAVETKFHVAESYFELFKSHKKLGREDEEKGDLEAGRRILREVMEDYPDPKYVPRVAYLLGQFAQELGQWNEAIDSYELIVRQYPEHSLAADAQYKLAQCYEESGNFEQALEAYVTLAATYPKSPLIANVMIRIGDYFYKKENYEVAAQVGEKFLERFEGHQHASRIAFRVGQAYYKGKSYAKASKAFDEFVKRFPDDALCSDSLFWSGESHRMAGAVSDAFRRYNRCRWDFPSSEAAKYARGRLTLPEMLQQFETEASNLEEQ